MIAHLQGKVLYKLSDELCITSDGLGWAVKLYDPERVQLGSSVELYIHTHFRENEISLWGFSNLEDLKFFKMLVAVSGVGPKTAQSLIGVKGISAIISAVKVNDPSALKISGVGTKTAQKIILEIRDKVDAFYESDTLENVGGEEGEQSEGVYNELRSALEALGYSHNDVNKFISKRRESDGDEKIEDLIKAFLKSA